MIRVVVTLWFLGHLSLVTAVFSLRCLMAKSDVILVELLIWGGRDENRLLLHFVLVKAWKVPQLVISLYF